MAKFGISYSLCPLIDQRSLLGVSEDSENGHVIVTLGKNIVVRYKLIDQKQVSSWSSKDKFTSPVIFDRKLKNYVSVTNQNQIRMWDANEQQLDKIKKLKFEQQIHCLIPQPNEDPSLVVFSDGKVLTLDEALSRRKESTVPLQSDSVIQGCQLVSYQERNYVTYLMVSPTETNFHLVSHEDPNLNVKITLQKPNATLCGQTILYNEEGCFLYTLWSDNTLYSMRLFSEQVDPLETLVHVITDIISTKHTVSMTPLSNSYIAMYGSDISEEGAIIVIYNTSFKMIQAKQRSKLFGIAPQLWHIGTNLFVASINYLSVVPYRLGVAQLAALVGTNNPQRSSLTKVVWCEYSNPTASEARGPKCIDARIKTLSKMGWPRETIFNEILPQLIEKKDATTILWCLKNMGDISEKLLVELLKFCLSENDSTFDHMGLNGTVVEESMEGVGELNPEPNGRKKFLDAILESQFNDTTLIPYLRSISFSNTLYLLDHLGERLSRMLDVKSIEWVGHVLDSHYQTLLLSKDPKVVTILSAVRAIVLSQISDIEEVKSLAPILQQLIKGKSPYSRQQRGSKNYSIEVLHLY